MFSRAMGSPWLWTVILLSGLAFPILRAASVPTPAPLPVLSRVPAFQFTDEKGQAFSSDSLRGKIWVANFIFTRCTSICPNFTRKMAVIQERTRGLGDRIHLISFTVDPEFDSPGILSAYAKIHRASPRAWSFLTGDRDALARLLVQGLKVPMSRGAPPTGDDLMGIGHGGHFVLVDDQMGIRGYYDSADENSVERIAKDIRAIASSTENAGAERRPFPGSIGRAVSRWSPSPGHR